METFWFSPPINLIEGDKFLLAVSSFEATNSVFNTIDKTIAFPLAHQVIGVPKIVKNLLTN